MGTQQMGEAAEQQCSGNNQAENYAAKYRLSHEARQRKGQASNNVEIQ